MASVIDAPAAVRERMVLSVDGEEQEQPQHVEVLLICSGPHDIASSDFDDERPLIFDVGADIVTIIGSPRVEPQGAEVPAVSHHGRELRVSKCLIKRGQRIVVSLLIDGQRPSLTRKQASLRDVTVRKFTGEGPSLGLMEKVGIWLTFIAFSYFVLFLLVKAVTPLDEHPWLNEIAASIAAWLVVAWVVLAAGASFARSIRKLRSWYRRRPRNS